MAILYMVSLRHIIHPANGAGTGLVASAAGTMHGTYISRGVFLPVPMRFCCFGGFRGCFFVFVVFMVVAVAAAGPDKDGQANKDQ